MGKAYEGTSVAGDCFSMCKFELEELRYLGSLFKGGIKLTSASSTDEAEYLSIAC